MKKIVLVTQTYLGIDDYQKRKKKTRRDIQIKLFTTQKGEAA